MKNQIKKAEQLREMHNNGMLYLPNAWNGGSARIFEKEGFKAIGTTSAGIAYSLGYEDGEKISFEHIIRVVKEIISITDIPLTVDIERGYGESDIQVQKNVEEIISLGAVGINIEDGIPQENQVDTIEEFIRKIKAIVDLREKIGIPFVINARTDIYLLNIGDEQEKMEKTIERAQRLKEIGADCIFIPGALDEETIIKLREKIDMPINLFVHNAFSNCRRLEEIGINRLSSGSAVVRSAFNKVKELSNEFGDSKVNGLLEHDFNYGEANSYFRK